MTDNDMVKRLAWAGLVAGVGALASIIEDRVENLPGFRGAYEAFLAVCYAHAGRLESRVRARHTPGMA